MTVEGLFFTLVKAVASPAIKAISNLSLSKFKTSQARKKALQGEDLGGQGGLSHLVKEQLKAFADSSAVPSGYQPGAYRNWLQGEGNLNHFVDAFVALLGDLPELTTQAEAELATAYEQLTHSTQTLDRNSVRQVVAAVYGQLLASPHATQALHLALQQRVAARVERLTPPELLPFPSDDDLARLEGMANELIAAGRRSWKMPEFVAPLTMTVHERGSEHDAPSTNASQLLAQIGNGDNLVIHGVGGIGKTTLLLELCSSCSLEGGRIPLYVDVAAWARTQKGLLDYVASRPAAQGIGVTVVELTRLAKSGRLVIMLNGWNEASVTPKQACSDSINDLMATTESLNVVVVSRTSGDVPSLKDTKTIEVRGLTWGGQSDVIRAELKDVESGPLLELLARNSSLRHAARSPLILQGLIVLAREDSVEDTTAFDMLEAIVRDYEGDCQRRSVFDSDPVHDHQQEYLEELACQLTQLQATNCSKNDALRFISSVANRLLADGLLGTATPNPSDVLTVLASHHLLFLSDGVVRFAHHRFQEYFSAKRLLRACIGESIPQNMLMSAVNQTSWDESLVLVADRLKAYGDSSARVRLIGSAIAIDLGLACDLARICGFSEADDATLYQQLLERVSKLTESALHEVRELGTAYQIASGFTAFAESLWPLLESDDQQVRLHTHQLNGEGLLFTQLGPVAVRRTASWPSKQRAEFVHEIGRNPENWGYIVQLANTESDSAVRAAAISTLFWEFPASNEAQLAWLNAPEEVQINGNLLSYVLHDLEEGAASDEVVARLEGIDSSDAYDGALITLAQILPEKVGPRALEAIFKGLKADDRHGGDAQLVAIAKHNDSERLLSIARNRALHENSGRGWVEEYFKSAPAVVKAETFAQAFQFFQRQNFDRLNEEMLGPLADYNQVEQVIGRWLTLQMDCREWTDIDRNKYYSLGRLLQNVSGGELMNVVIHRARDTSYAESVQLVELVWKRAGDAATSEITHPWLPTVDEVRHLVRLFADKPEPEEEYQDSVRVYLSSIASKVDPIEFEFFLFETVERHLDAWSGYRDKCSQWQFRQSGPRPSNPFLGNYLVSAVEKMGFDALEGLMALMSHTCASEFVPDAIIRIISQPWNTDRSLFLSNTVSAAIQRGKQRRESGLELQQPEEGYQRLTDEVAGVFSTMLNELISNYEEEKGAEEEWNQRAAEHRVGKLASQVAIIPSAAVVESVLRALTCGLMNKFGTVAALRGLVNQGLCITDVAVVSQLEVLYKQEAEVKWHDQSARYQMSEFSLLLLCAIPTPLLSQPTNYYLEHWGRFDYEGQIIRHLGDSHTEAAWPLLIEISKKASNGRRDREHLVESLVSSLRTIHLKEFLDLIASGMLFDLCQSEWTWERQASSIADVLSNEPEQIEPFLNACRNVQSFWADALAVNTLSHIPGCEETRSLFLLEVLDAGRAQNNHMPAHRMLIAAFKRKEPDGGASYEVLPIANSELRMELYTRAKGLGSIADGCKRLLASLELERREMGRPSDELRHPVLEDGIPWTDALLVERND